MAFGTTFLTRLHRSSKGALSMSLITHFQTPVLCSLESPKEQFLGQSSSCFTLGIFQEAYQRAHLHPLLQMTPGSREVISSLSTTGQQVNMTFNSTKFECLRYRADSEAPSFQYLAPDKTPIQVKEDLRDLGTRISSNLNFNIHIQNTVTAASIPN